MLGAGCWGATVDLRACTRDRLGTGSGALVIGDGAFELESRACEEGSRREARLRSPARVPNTAELTKRVRARWRAIRCAPRVVLPFTLAVHSGTATSRWFCSAICVLRCHHALTYTTMRAVVTFLLLAVAAVASAAETNDDVRSVDSATVRSNPVALSLPQPPGSTTSCMVEVATPTPRELAAAPLLRAPPPASPALTA